MTNMNKMHCIYNKTKTYRILNILLKVKGFRVDYDVCLHSENNIYNLKPTILVFVKM